MKVYPTLRRVVLEAFDAHPMKLTRTQQILLLALNKEEMLSMSEIARRICTSNEQATRAVAQLVDISFVSRSQNAANRHTINISLTDKAKSYINEISANVFKKLDIAYDEIDDNQSEDLSKCLDFIANLNGHY
ncbi:MAG: MarR family transcriptional regulator [Ruminococcus sp.]|nr:MarR family transcriptional regulator [Ruminococcus sp.]